LVWWNGLIVENYEQDEVGGEMEYSGKRDFGKYGKLLKPTVLLRMIVNYTK